MFADQRSQVYGGIAGETPRGRQAVDATTGLVLTYGPDNGKIFRAYFSSCCGGVTQAASDAFPGQPYIRPLSEQFHGALCAGSKYFNWGPITISKGELARRIRLWAQRNGRPSRVLITDVRGMQYSWPAEDLRSAVDTDASAGSTLPSSFCKIKGDASSDAVTFYDGHGYGHGVGMCQWCAEAQAAAGQSYQQILVNAYPDAKLVRAY
jgi:stage II sporulation protein D